MSVTTGRDLFKKVPIDSIGAGGASGQNQQERALKERGVDAGRDLFNDKKGNNR